MKDYFIGVDGGGTKTEFVLTENNGTVLNRIVLKGCNPNDIGVFESCKIISDGIKTLLKDPSVTCSEVSVYAGVSGAGIGENAKTMTEKLRKDFPEVIVKSDLTNAVETCLKGEKGIAVICGTGISCAVYNGETYKVVGGYGHLFENGGSGYSIGKDGIIAALKAEDGYGKDTVLKEYAYQIYGSPLRAALPRLLSGGKHEVSQMSPLVFRGAENGDKVCIEILENNFNSVIKFLNSVKELFSSKNCKIGFIGGITKTQFFRSALKRAYFENELVFTSLNPVYGAVRLAAKAADKKCDDEFDENYEQSLGRFQNA